MQGNTQVIDYFKVLLRGELAARDQYFAHSRIYEDQGFTKLFTRLDHEMQEETQHADALLRRILMLGGRPDMRTGGVVVGIHRDAGNAQVVQRTHDAQRHLSAVGDQDFGKERRVHGCASILIASGALYISAGCRFL